jgi:hypothetical protein
MSTSVSKYLPRHNGTTKTISLDERPICKHCKNPMKIVSSTVVASGSTITNVDGRYAMGEMKNPSSQKTQSIHQRAILIMRCMLKSQNSDGDISLLMKR